MWKKLCRITDSSFIFVELICELVENIKLNKRFILGITLVSAMGGLLFGYDWVVIGGAKPFYERFFEITQSPNLQGWAMSSALIGCLFGAIISGYLSDRFGRKIPLIGAAALFTIAAIGTGAVNQFTLFVIFRLIGGLGIGLASALSPMYIAEISPAPPLLLNSAVLSICL